MSGRWIVVRMDMTAARAYAASGARPSAGHAAFTSDKSDVAVFTSEAKATRWAHAWCLRMHYHRITDRCPVGSCLTIRRPRKVKP